MASQYNVLISQEELKSKVLALRTEASQSACIIFGAGASYGYSDEHTYNPPTVKDLFDESNLAVREIINQSKHLFIKNNKIDFSRELRNYENDLEKYLSSLYSSNKDDNIFGSFLSYLEDIFFLASRDVVSGSSNNYRTLINLMWGSHGKKQWSCLSFNYDTILEKSYLIADRDTTGRKFNRIEDYKDANPVILKMHGGINFRYTFRKLFEDRDVINHTSHVLFSKMMSDSSNMDDFLKVIDPNQGKPILHYDTLVLHESVRRRMSDFNFPLMLIPIHASVAPENIYFREQINLAKQQIEKASLIIAIGYNFGDVAFTESLKEIDYSNKEIILIGTLSASKNPESYLGFQRLKQAWPNAKIRVFEGNGFGDFIEALS